MAVAGLKLGWEAHGFPLSTRGWGSLDVQPGLAAFSSRDKGTRRLRELAERQGPAGGEAFR